MYIPKQIPPGSSDGVFRWVTPRCPCSQVPGDRELPDDDFTTMEAAYAAVDKRMVKALGWLLVTWLPRPEIGEGHNWRSSSLAGDS